jgi:hypothetical protein
MTRAADVGGGGSLRVGLGAVDVRPGGRMEDESCLEAGGRRERYIPVLVPEREDAVPGERVLKRTAELPARAGDQDSGASSSDRIGDRVLQRSTTRGSSHGHSFSSGSSASYSSLTWYSISTSVRASNPCARLPGT